MQLTEFEQSIIKNVLKTPFPGKAAAESALRHIERAWKLKTDMPELAAFSAITAEEEAATAIIRSLQRKKYTNADCLNRTCHDHKAAFEPFFRAVAKLLSEPVEQLKPNIFFDNKQLSSGEEILCLRYMINGSDGTPYWGYPLLPLEFNVEVDGVLHDFKDELQQLATENNSKTIQRYIKKLANHRNLALYAGDKMPRVKNPLPFVDSKKSIVFNHLKVYLLIDQYPQQSFVQQMLNVFVTLLKNGK